MPHRPENSQISRCPRCHGRTLAWPAVNNFECTDCGFTLFLNTAAAVAVIIEHKGKILFGVRKNDPGRGLLDLPGGFVDPCETAEEAALREVREETGIVLHELRYLCSFPNTYPYRDVVYHTLDLVYVSRLQELPPLHAADDLEQLLWIERSLIRLDHIAFPSLRQALATYLTDTSVTR